MPFRKRKPPTRILITRHGQTTSNKEGRFCGHFEAALTPLGVRQSQALAGRLALVPIDAVYTSDLGRAVDTAAHALRDRGLSAVIEPRLRELHYGEWEGERERDIAKLSPAEYRLMRNEDPAWRPPGGETVAEVRTRTNEALAEIAGRHEHQTVLIVSHGTAINCLLSGVLGMALTHTFRFEISNCGLSEVVYRRNIPVVRLLNDTQHLAGLK